MDDVRYVTIPFAGLRRYSDGAVTRRDLQSTEDIRCKCYGACDRGDAEVRTLTDTEKQIAATLGLSEKRMIEAKYAKPYRNHRDGRNYDDEGVGAFDDDGVGAFDDDASAYIGGKPNPRVITDVRRKR